MNSPKTLDEMIVHVKEHNGWTMFPPDLDALGDREEIATHIAEASDTVLEWNCGGSPRFMPKSKEQCDSIRRSWAAVGLDINAYDRDGNLVQSYRGQRDER